MNIWTQQRRAMQDAADEMQNGDVRRKRARTKSFSTASTSETDDVLEFDNDSTSVSSASVGSTQVESGAHGYVRSELSETAAPNISAISREFLRIEKLLTNKHLPEQRRKELLAMRLALRDKAAVISEPRVTSSIDELRAMGNVEGSVEARGGDGGGGGGEGGGGGDEYESECAICCESFRLYHQTQLASQERRTNNGNKLSTRMQSAVMANADNVGDEYAKIFRFEELMRGYMRDSEIFNQMRHMQNDRIYKRMQWLGLPCVAWTTEMLKTHYRGRRPHIFDEMRMAIQSLEITNTLLRQVAANCAAPDPNNAARVVVDTKMVTLYERLAKEKRAEIATIRQYHREKDQNLAAAMFALANVLSSTGKTSAPIECDPRVAAGTLQSGTTLVSSNTVTQSNSVLRANQAHFYTMNGL